MYKLNLGSMLRGYKFTKFIIISAIFHMFLFLFTFANLPASNIVQHLAIGLVQRPFPQFSHSTQNAEITETLKIIPQPTAALTKQTAVTDQKQQLPQAKTKINKVPSKTVGKLPTAELTQGLVGPDQQLQTPVAAKKTAKGSVENPLKVTEMTSAVDALVDLTLALEVGEGGHPPNGSLARLGSATTRAIALPATPEFQDALPRYDQNPRPNYPEVSRRRGQEGTVLLEVLVHVDGSVTKAAIARSSGHKYLDLAALTAVRRWQFRPATSSGLPVSSRVVVPVDFVLHEEN